MIKYFSWPGFFLFFFSILLHRIFSYTFFILFIFFQHKTTLFTTLVAAISSLLVRYGNNEGLCIAVPVANRDVTSGLLKSVGYYVNTVLLSFAPSETMSFDEVISYAKEIVTGAQKHAQVPYQKVVSEAMDRGSPGAKVSFAS